MSHRLCKKCAMVVSPTNYTCSRCGTTWPYYRNQNGGFISAKLVAATAILAAVAAGWAALLTRF